jgi:hypothetical protein
MAAWRSGHQICLKNRVRIPPGYKVSRENISMLLCTIDLICMVLNLLEKWRHWTQKINLNKAKKQVTNVHQPFRGKNVLKMVAGKSHFTTCDRRSARPIFLRARKVNSIKRGLTPNQGCQIFRGTTYQNRKNIPHYHKLHQITSIYSRGA